ncbi:uncharacterized protein LOC143449538 [Clavelina lepadiformis]|uniref:uncharacterized protein LOC143449538 n=1 Tax=Clavelina lepadiformis TaxID=159417 RepID=UPI004040EB21
MASYHNDNWLEQCMEELSLPGSPWHEVRDLVAERLAYRITLEGFTYEQLALVAKFISDDFIKKHRLYESAKRSNTSIATRQYTEREIQVLLKELTFKAAHDAECSLPNSPNAPECFSNLVDLTKKIVEPTNFKHGQHTDRLAQSVVKVLQKDSSKLGDVTLKLKGRYLPKTLRRYLYRLLLINKRKNSPGTGRSGAAAVFNDDLTQLKMREAFAASVKKGVLEFKSKQPTKTPVSHLIQSSVLETFETTPGLKPFSDDLTLQQDMCRMLNILYTHRKNFETFYIYLLFPLHSALSKEIHSKQQDYEIAMWLDIIIGECLPLWPMINDIVLSVWSEIIDSNLNGNSSNDADIKTHFCTLGIDSDVDNIKLTLEQPFKDDQSQSYASLIKFYTAHSDAYSHPVTFIRSWVFHLFVGVTNVMTTMYIWDQLFLHNWSQTCFKRVCLVLFHCISSDIRKCKEKKELLSLLTDGMINVNVPEMAQAWKLLDNITKVAMINTRNVKTLFRNRLFKLVLCILFLLLIAQVLFQAPESSSFPRTNVAENAVHEEISHSPILLVVLIMTGPRNSDRRKAIRQTWLSDHLSAHDKEVLHHFVIGMKNLPSDVAHDVRKEYESHKDLLLLEDFEDAYEKLTEKLGRMLEWVDKNCNYKYILKADDDTFVRLDQVLDDLKSDPEKQLDNLYWGYFYGRSHVKQSGPWKETNWKLCDYYLPYARGGGYIISQNLVKFIATNWHQFQLYLSEDVTLAVWLAPLVLNRIHDVRFDTEYKSRGCKNAFVVSHKQSVEDMYRKDRNLRTMGKPCEKETIAFHGYVYDWSGPPTKCCVRADGIP